MTWMLLLAASAAQASPNPIEIRFCPAAAVRPYPLDSLRGVQGLLVQNVAIINRGSAPVAIDRVTLSLANGDALLDTRRVEGRSLDAAIAGGQAAKAQGMFDLFKFQFCYGKDVRAGAAGTVVKLITGAAEPPPMRKPGEAMDAYYGRVGARQAENFARARRRSSGIPW